MKKFDLIALGGGNAMNVAIAAGKRGLRAAVIEEERLGGTCGNFGCIPSKLLLGYAEAATRVREVGRFHIDADLRSVDGPALLAETFAATRQTDGKLAKSLGENVSLFRGRGRFVKPLTIEVGDERLRGARIVVGTGTRPRQPVVQGVVGTPYWTSCDVFDMESLPASIIVVGGGSIGVELAQFFHGVGVATTLLHRGPFLLQIEDEEVQRVFTAGFSERVPTRLSTEIASVAHGPGGFTVVVKTGAKEETLRAERLLFALGRIPNTDALGVDAAGIALDEKGWIRVDDRLRTTAKKVWALGDVIGGPQFTHTAAFEAVYLEGALLDRKRRPIDRGVIPHAVFSMPEVASVGPTEKALREKGVQYLAASLPYSTAARGRAMKERHGLCKVLIAPDGALLACHIVGESASVLIHQAMMALKWKPHVKALTELMYIHPALSEVLRNTARNAAAMVERPDA
jgi:dihydrolipoamide dehydrogenase